MYKEKLGETKVEQQQLFVFTFRATCLPDVLIGDDEGLAQGLCGVEPHPWVLLYSSRQLASDGGCTGVEGTGDGR